MPGDTITSFRPFSLLVLNCRIEFITISTWIPIQSLPIFFISDSNFSLYFTILVSSIFFYILRCELIIFQKSIFLDFVFWNGRFLFVRTYVLFLINFHFFVEGNFFRLRRFFIDDFLYLWSLIWVFIQRGRRNYVRRFKVWSRVCHEKFKV